MQRDKYTIHAFFLFFRNKETETAYKEYITNRTLLFCRVSWGIVLFLGTTFALLDKQMFGNNSSIIIIVRFTLMLLAALVLLATFTDRLQQYIDQTPFIFISSIGIFCTILTAYSNPNSFSPYFTGVFFAFTGILSVAGLGFRYSFFALLLVFIIFEVVLGVIRPVAGKVFLVYSFFLAGMTIIFVYIGYLIENIFRKNYIVSARLSDSLNKVKKLSGLLPMCAHCKKIRDDEGYWQQVEHYISKHSEAEFSHGMCPECAEEFYAGEEWFACKK